MKCLFVYNPISGKSTSDKKRDYIVKSLKESFDTVDVCATKAKNDLIDIAFNACGVYDALVFAGGDGSVNEVINGVLKGETRPILGYIPTGTVNDFARSNNIPKSLKKALKVIKEFNVKDVDVVKINDSYFSYVAAVGPFTQCSYSAKQVAKKRLGKLAYIFNILLHGFKFKDINVSVNGERVSAGFIIALNTRSVGGFRLNKRAVLDDGLIDLVVIKRKKRNFFTNLTLTLRIIKMFLFGVKSLKGKAYKIVKGSEFTIKGIESYVWNLDGERGFTGDAKIQTVQKAIKLIK